jgi:two-component system chemotaxis response regulator CheY
MEVGMRALIVDDSRAMRVMLGRMMTELGFAVSEAANGAEALGALASARPDLVLLDWNMPELNGFETLQAIRANPALADLPVIMVTTETEMPRVAQAVQAGVSEYVMKPFDKDVLLGKLELLGLLPAAS